MMIEKIFLEKPHNIFIIDKQIDTKCRLVRREKERKKNAEKKCVLMSYRLLGYIYVQYVVHNNMLSDNIT